MSKGLPFDWLNTIARKRTREIKDAGLCRKFELVERSSPGRYFFDSSGSPVISFCSNDYLSLSAHSKVIAAAREALVTNGVGTCGSRNIGGTNVDHVELEKCLASVHRRESALLFSSGFIANFAAVVSLIEEFGRAQEGITFVSDRLNHASLIDGMRLGAGLAAGSGSPGFVEVKVFEHNDVASCKLAIEEAKFGRKVVIAESIYSMEGDRSPIAELASISRSAGALFLLNEVHAVGVFGRGGGLAVELPSAHGPDLVVGSLSKAFGSFGGYLAGDAEVIDWLRLVSRFFIFTSTLPVSVARAARAAVEIACEEDDLRHELFERVSYLRRSLAAQGILALGDARIVPVVVSSVAWPHERAIGTCEALSRSLLSSGFYATTMKYPTVPLGMPRLRLSVTPLHEKREIDEFVSALSNFWGALGIERVSA